MKARVPSPLVAIAPIKSSSKPSPRPKALVLMPLAVRPATLAAISAVLVRPSLAWPSESSNTRFRAFGSRCSATCMAPASQPSKSAVQPPLWIVLIAAMKANGSATGVEGTTTCISPSKVTIARRSRAVSSPTRNRAALRALLSLRPAIEPDRSITRAKLSGGRGWTCPAGSSGVAMVSSRSRVEAPSAATAGRRGRKRSTGWVMSKKG